MCGDELGSTKEEAPQTPLNTFRPPDANSSFYLPSSLVQQRKKHLSSTSTISRGLI